MIDRRMVPKRVTLTVEFDSGHTFSHEVSGLTAYEATIERHDSDPIGVYRGHIIIEGLVKSTVGMASPSELTLDRPAKQQRRITAERRKLS